jgi:hypothetical protein
VMLLVFGNRLRTRFTVSDDGVRCESLDRTARASSRAALVAGIITGRPGAAGSGLLAMTQEDQTLRWRGAFSASADAGRHTIALRNRWRTLLTVYCSAENFQAVRARVERHMAAHGTAARAQGPSRLRAYLRDTALAVLASLPLLLADRVYGYGLLLPLLLMCFAVATVWFVRHLAWVTLLCGAGLAGAIVLAALAPRASVFSGHGTRPRYEWLSGDDWALTAAGVAGLAYLAWQAVRVLRRRVQPALEADLGDGGDA